MIYRYLSVVVFVLLSSVASGFEGSITLVKQTFYDTTYYIFTVKDRLVRIDERSTKKEVMQSLIIDLKSKSITALSPSQKLFTSIQKLNDIPDYQKDFTVIKGENFKYIDGYKCYLWRVRSKDLNMETSFWVFESDLNFFSEVTGLLSRTQDYSRYSLYFDLIPNSRGYFPMLMVEKTLLRDEKMKISVVQINRKKVSDKIFSVPNTYRCLRY